MNTVEAYPNVIVGGAECAFDLVERAIERIPGAFRGPGRAQVHREMNFDSEERRSERVRIARELHDTLLQGFIGASLLLHQAVEQTPADSPSKPSLTRALRLVHQAIDEGRVVLQGLRSASASTTSMSLEDALSKLGDECGPESAMQFRLLVSGHSRAMKPTVQEQIYLIAREALVNALRHSEATSIEAEVEYLPGRIRVAVRDNGRGIDPEVIRSGRRSGHWGMASMRERAENMGARFKVRSRAAAGTEVELSVPSQIAFPHQSPQRPLGWLARIYLGKTRRTVRSQAREHNERTSPNPSP
jgi:signal transduction histidine kinase